MFDIGGTELLVIGVVALIVVGPKDLPGMFHTVGRFTAKARAMGREFSRAMEDAAKESGVDEVTRDLREMTSKKGMGLDALETAASKFEKWDPMKPAAKDADASAGKVSDKASGNASSGQAKKPSRAKASAAKTPVAKAAAQKPATAAKPKAPPKAASKTAAPKAASPAPKPRTSAPRKSAS